MNLDLQRLFTRSLASDGPVEAAPARGNRPARNAGIFMVLCAALAVVLVVVGAIYLLLQPVTLRIAVGPANNDDVKVIQALSHAFARERGYVRLRPVVTDGAAASAAAFANKTVDLAVIRSDVDVPKEATSVAVLRKNMVVLWVPPAAKGARKSRITKIQNLAGHRIGVVGRTPANVKLLNIILRQYGIDPAKVEVVQFAPTEIADAVRGRKADAFLTTGPLNGKITSEALAAAGLHEGGEPTFLAIDAADAIAQNFPAYESAEISAGSLGGVPPRPDDDVKTISFAHHIVAQKALSDTTIAALTRQIFAVRQNVIAEVPAAVRIEPPDTAKDADIPAHPGAAAYVDGEEKSFLDRYSDYIWWSILGLSAMGSAGAWFASYLKRDERQNNSTLRTRLLDMLTLARRANTHEELDTMQAEADTILRDTLHCFEHGAIDEGALTAFNVALEQFHAAIADRRSMLMAMPARPAVQLRA